MSDVSLGLLFFRAVDVNLAQLSLYVSAVVRAVEKSTEY